MNVYVRRHKNVTLRAFLFTVNYCLFANKDVSIRFNVKNDNVVLELLIKYFCKSRYIPFSVENINGVHELF